MLILHFCLLRFFISRRKPVSEFCCILMLLLHCCLKQGSHIRIYDVERGWKVQKNILAKSLRWTVTDTSLSPGQRHLVSFYATMNHVYNNYASSQLDEYSLAMLFHLNSSQTNIIQNSNNYNNNNNNNNKY